MATQTCAISADNAPDSNFFSVPTIFEPPSYDTPFQCQQPEMLQHIALGLANIQYIDIHHKVLTNKLFQNIKESAENNLKHVLQEKHRFKTHD